MNPSGPEVFTSLKSLSLSRLFDAEDASSQIVVQIFTFVAAKEVSVIKNTENIRQRMRNIFFIVV